MRIEQFAHSDPGEDEDLARFARMTPEQRLRLFFELCDLTDSVQAALPNRDALRAAQPLSEEAAALWKRLMRGASHG